MENLTHIGNGSLLLQAGRGAVRMAAARLKASPRVAFGAALAALVAGIGGNALLFQGAGGGPPPSVPGTQGGQNAMAVQPVPAHAPPRAAPASTAPATTASLGPATGAERPGSAAPAAGGAKRAERRAAASRQADLIGAFLNGMTADAAAHPAPDPKDAVRRPHHASSRRDKGQ
jgi:hypothetical protein